MRETMFAFPLPWFNITVHALVFSPVPDCIIPEMPTCLLVGRTSCSSQSYYDIWPWNGTLIFSLRFSFCVTYVLSVYRLLKNAVELSRSFGKAELGWEAKLEHTCFSEIRLELPALHSIRQIKQLKLSRCPSLVSALRLKQTIACLTYA